MITFADWDVSLVSLADLEAVLAVSECRQFIRAGEILNRSQPSVSRSVQDVESSVRTSLFDRDSRPIRRVPGNEDFFYELRKGLFFVRRAFARLGRNTRAASAVLEVGHSSYFDADLLTYLAHVNKLPDVGFSALFYSSFTAEIVANVLAGAWDCGFVLRPAETFDLEVIPVMQDRLGVLMARDHPLARQRSIDLHDLGNEPLILPMRHRNPALRAWFLERCRAVGFAPEIVQEISHPQEASILAEQHIGVALAMQATAKWTNKGATVFRPFADKGLAVEIQLVTGSGPKSPALQAFINTVLMMRKRIDRKAPAQATRKSFPVSRSA